MLTEIGRTWSGTGDYEKHAARRDEFRDLIVAFLSACHIVLRHCLQSNRDTLTRCIDELRKEIDRNR